MSGLDIASYRLPAHRAPTIDDLLREVLAEFNLGPWVNHLSPSSFAMAQRCKYQWQQRYIHGRRQRPAEAPVMGTAVHAALERNFAAKIDSHEDLDRLDLLNWYMDEGFAQVVRVEQEKAGEEILWDDPTVGGESARRRGRDIIDAYHSSVAPRIQPLAVETVFRTDLGLPVPVEGRFDLERAETTVDFKTGKSATRKPKEDWRIQAMVYGRATGKPVEFHSLSATAKSRSVTIVTPLESEALLVNPSEDEVEQMRRTLQLIVAELCLCMAIYGPDDAWPANGVFHQWACDYCGFRSGCPAWKGRT